MVEMATLVVMETQVMAALFQLLVQVELLFHQKYLLMAETGKAMAMVAMVAIQCGDPVIQADVLIHVNAFGARRSECGGIYRE